MTAAETPRVALVTTTIGMPHVLELYRAVAPEVAIFVAGDRKTPHDEVRAFVEGLGHATYLSDGDQEDLGTECSEIIGWNKVMRRNLASLEAIRSGADVVVTIDDDNIPLGRDYFTDIARVLTTPYDGPLARADSGWFDIGQYLSPPVHHRGFSHAMRGGVDLGVRLEATVGARASIAAGLWLGDPDIDAVDRISQRPYVRDVTQLLRTGILVDNHCLSPLNSQATAFHRDVAPLMMVQVGVGRYDDIWAYYVAQHVMAGTEHHIHYGRPFVYQERNPQVLWRNLENEVFGMENTPRFTQALKAIPLESEGILDRLAEVYEKLGGLDYLPEEFLALGQAWCRDVRRVLG